MKHCENCGNIYSKLFSITMNGQTYKFDCFECAIHRLAPNCYHCGTRIIGHGVAAAETIFCSAHCAREEGFTNLNDHTQTQFSNFIK